LDHLAIRILANILAIWAGSMLFPTIHLDGPGALVIAGLVLTMINLLVRPVLLFLTLPINILTLGLFTLVINTWMVFLTARFVTGFSVPGYWTAFGLAILVSVSNLLFKPKKSRHI